MPQSDVRDVQHATLGGGCFWCLEAVFSRTQGVIQAISGYANGHHPAPTYEEVCTGQTGHAEVVQITFDATRISFPELLDIFFTIHDPTTLNRQGHDVGTQYRSAIFYHDDAQRAAAEAMIARLTAEGVWSAPIVTEVSPAASFFVAEAYHHQYFRRNPQQAYCMAVVAPKAMKLRRVFAERLKAD